MSNRGIKRERLLAIQYIRCQPFVVADLHGRIVVEALQLGVPALVVITAIDADAANPCTFVAGQLAIAEALQLIEHNAVVRKD